MHHYLYFVSVMFADHSATYAAKWSNRPHLASSCGSYHVGNENKELQSEEKKSGYLQLAVSSDWRKLAVNGHHPKEKKKVVFIGYFAYYTPL